MKSEHTCPHGHADSTMTSHRLTCHVCGSRIGVRQPRPDVPPTCPRNTCQLAASGIITLAQAHARLAMRRYR
jgi:hypothetical protein